VPLTALRQAVKEFLTTGGEGAVVVSVGAILHKPGRLMTPTNLGYSRGIGIV
jgi:hypothetical protein